MPLLLEWEKGRFLIKILNVFLNVGEGVDSAQSEIVLRLSILNRQI